MDGWMDGKIEKLELENKRGEGRVKKSGEIH